MPEGLVAAEIADGLEDLGMTEGFWTDGAHGIEDFAPGGILVGQRAGELRGGEEEFGGIGHEGAGEEQQALGALTASEQAQITLVDTGPCNMAPGGDFSTNYEDGIHPNAAGKTLMTNDFLSLVFSAGGGIRRLANGLMLGL